MFGGGASSTLCWSAAIKDRIMKQLLLFAFVLSAGCLAQYDPFDEKEFVNAYVELVCPMIQDCTDGEVDGAWSSDMSGIAEECAAYSQTPLDLSCTIRGNYAKSCYDEAVNVSALNDCSAFNSWLDNSSGACSQVFLNCVTDKPFGSYRPDSPYDDEN